MGQPRIIEVEYHDFLKILQQAADLRNKIDKADKERWAGFVRKHKVPEAGMAVKAKAGAMSGNTRSAIRGQVLASWFISPHCLSSLAMIRMNFAVDLIGDVGNQKFLPVYWRHARLTYP